MERFRRQLEPEGCEEWFLSKATEMMMLGTRMNLNDFPPGQNVMQTATEDEIRETSIGGRVRAP